MATVSSKSLISPHAPGQALFSSSGPTALEIQESPPQQHFQGPQFPGNCRVVLGFELLRLLEVKIDYRDGLVDFVYGSKR